MHPWLLVEEGKITLRLHVQPGARETKVTGLHLHSLRIRLAAEPVDGKANAALVAFVAARLGLAKSMVTLKSGKTSRHKVLEVSSAPTDAARRLLSDA